MLRRLCDRCGQKTQEKYAAVRIETNLEECDEPTFTVCLGYDLCERCVTTIRQILEQKPD